MGDRLGVPHSRLQWYVRGRACDRVSANLRVARLQAADELEAGQWLGIIQNAIGDALNEQPSTESGLRSTSGRTVARGASTSSMDEALARIEAFRNDDRNAR